jgi:hypothetical protein
MVTTTRYNLVNSVTVLETVYAMDDCKSLLTQNTFQVGQCANSCIVTLGNSPTSGGTSSSTTSTTTNTHHGNIGSLVGALIAVIVVVGIAVAVAIYIVRRRKSAEQQKLLA